MYSIIFGIQAKFMFPFKLTIHTAYIEISMHLEIEHLS